MPQNALFGLVVTCWGGIIVNGVVTTIYDLVYCDIIDKMVKSFEYPYVQGPQVAPDP